ncbi:MAG: hypothetical protein HUU54_13355 [Ignavibacteriaceae bacterium]|nr:hypothetical protein [Ignavibacteriaceae bacterium]
MPKVQGGDRRSNNFKSCTAATFENTKEEKIKELGFDKYQVHRFETLAKNTISVCTLNRIK